MEMAGVTRRRFLWLAAGAGAAAVGGAAALRFGLPRWVRPGPSTELSDEARAFVEACFEGLDRARIWDTHVHLIGLGSGDTGCWINPEMRSHLHPIKRFQFDVYRASLGMFSEETADEDYVERLLAVHREANPSGKLLLLGFDLVVGEDGVEHPELSSFYTPNEYVLGLARRHEELVACASIHPYRGDAIDRLDAVVESGARAIKWLPNAMSIDPASAMCDRFYRRLAELDLPLISHGGLEYAVDAGHGQELGNPLRLRRALDEGVRVVVAHVAGFGSYGDPRRSAFDLLMEMFADPQYESNLFADISAVTQINRSGRFLRELLAARELHHRLVNGSDYPLPALRLLFSTGKWQLEGLLAAEQRRLCNKVAGANPLLFDFVLKRSLRFETGGRTHRFSPSIFETDWLFSEGIRLARATARPTPACRQS
jgi:mannonate dehydratase